MHWRGKDGSWAQLRWGDVENIVRYDLHKSPQIMAKVCEAHIKLTSWSRMRCHLATQLFRGLSEFAAWVQRKGWEGSRSEPPSAELAEAALGLAGYVDLAVSTQCCLERRDPVRCPQSPLLRQLLANGRRVHAWGLDLARAVEEGELQLPQAEPKPGSKRRGRTGRVGLPEQTHRDFQVGLGTVGREAPGGRS